MSIQLGAYRLWAYVKHLFTSWNTGGEGIHSPYLFYLVRMLVYDENRYYCWRDIERERHRLLASDEQIETIDYGTGGNAAGQKMIRRVADIARGHLERREVGELLFRLTSYLGHKQERPLRIVELGTSLGITTAYLAKADSRNRVTTYEGSPETVRIAREVWKRLGIANIEVVEGNIDETLPDSRAHDKIKGVDRKPIDIAYMDANHTEQATLAYYERLVGQAEAHSIFIVDDIHHSPEMARAWQTICEREEVTTTMDMYYFGLVFFDKHYLRRNYKLRI